MDQQDSGTFLEDFISSAELLPNNIRRNFELIRELDRDATESTKDYLEAEVITIFLKNYHFKFDQHG
jgi:uncharacterized protein YydD (DUF2326 family)